MQAAYRGDHTARLSTPWAACVVALIAAARDTQRRGDGTPARGQYRADQQYWSLPPGRVAEHGCEGSEREPNGMGRACPIPDTGVSMAGPRAILDVTPARLPCSYTSAK